MTAVAYYSTFAAVLAVGVVLVLGLATLLKGSSANRSQMFMRWRIGLQFVAIVVIMLAVYLFKR